MHPIILTIAGFVSICLGVALFTHSWIPMIPVAIIACAATVGPFFTGLGLLGVIAYLWHPIMSFVETTITKVIQVLS